MSTLDSPIVSLRRRRLQEWIDQKFGGRQASLIADIEARTSQKVNQGELSLILQGKKSFGEKKARKLELQAGMIPGHLDSSSSYEGLAVEPISLHEDTPEYLAPAPRKVQVRGVASVNEQGFIDQVSEDSDGNGYFLVDVEDRDAYYLKLRGTGSQFVVEPGWYILLAPNLMPEPSEKTIVKLANGQWFMGAFERQEGGEYVLRRPDGRLAVFREDEVEYLHPIHGTMSPRQLRRP